MRDAPDHTGHADYQGLLRAVLETPAADFPRLVLADWLDEHDDPDRAEYVRLSVEFEGTRCLRATFGDGPRDAYCDTSECRHCTIDRRCHFVVEANRPWWFPGVYPLLRVDDFVVARGFVAEVHFHLVDFLADAGALFNAHPITRVVLTDLCPVRFTYPIRFDDAMPDDALPNLPAFNWTWYCDRDSLEPVVPPSMICPIFTTEAAVLDWLSDRFVAHGRTLAGLRRLRAPASAPL